MEGFKAAKKPVQKIGGNIGKPKTLVDSDYTLLENKPCINGVTVEGNKSFEDYGLLFDGETIVEENGILKVSDGSHGHTVENIDGLQKALDAAADHAANEDNPHNVTKLQIGLGNVENKSSADIRGELTKDNVTDALGYTPPTASEIGAVLDAKADKTTLQSAEKSIADHKADTGNPHKVTKSQIGLGNVENKSSADIRGELTKDNVTAALGYTPSSESGVAETVTSTIRRQARPSELFRIF